MGDDFEQLVEAAMHLRIKAEHLATQIEAATDARWQALAHYPKLRQLLNKSLAKAAGKQQTALALAEQLHRLRDRARAIEKQCEAAQFRGGQVDGVRADLETIREILEAYAVTPEQAGEGEG